MPWSVEGLGKGVALAIKGVIMAISNPEIQKAKFHRTFFYLIITSFVVYWISSFALSIPLGILRLLVHLFAFLFGFDNAVPDAFFLSVSGVIRDALMSVPLVGMLFVTYLYPRLLDDLFMDSLRYIDVQEAMQEGRRPYASALAEYEFKVDYWGNIVQYLKRTYKRFKLSILVYALTFVPLIGRFVVPLAGAYTVIKSLGLSLGVAVGVTSYILPPGYGIQILSTLFAMRALTRELLEPYFARTRLNTRERARWFREREDVVFAFSAVVFWLVRIPFLSVLGFGVAQAAAAYLLVHVTEPPTKKEADEKNKRVKKGDENEDENEDIPTLDVRGQAQAHNQGQGHGHGQFGQFAQFAPQAQFRMYRG
ncbi:hypothetical protein BC936DRAFT_139485 [Jimgerdemannia flammicorona]|uniref:Transmembrane protein n=1 Tax=Jimgerdemannia flammicorona TaxID=994334 RepID=A0A433B9U6_9FUNG|nr:hypothetical protein BC936DRAFT_139485 [Jimgerdemannia flammicorona]